MIRSPAGFDGGDRIKRYLDYYQPSYGVMMLSAGQVAAFSPASLFASGEQGVWYDPSDMTTLFQDAAGTTPVTAVEQPVGLILDKSGRGNHATQSTSASRPVLSARVNLLTRTEEFDNAAWSRSDLTVASDQTSAPDGTSTADLLAETANSGAHQIFPTVSMTIGVAYTAVFHLKKGPGSTAPNWARLAFRSGAMTTAPWANFNISTGVVGNTSGAGITASITGLPNGWYRCAVTATANATSANGGGYVQLTNNTDTTASTVLNTYTGATTSNIYIWGADLRVSNAGVNLPVYQRVNTSTDYDTTGFPMYLRFDGTDDSMATGTINPGAVDKAQVFAGVRKLSDAAGGVVMELSVASAFNDGTLAFNAPAAGTPDYFWRSKGTISASSTTAASYPAPLTSVMTGIGDIAGDVSQLRYNGAQILNITTDQGTGNYLSYPLYIGRRGGTTLPFNGHLYSLILRFSAANLDAATITATETWVNGKTYAY